MVDQKTDNHNKYYKGMLNFFFTYEKVAKANKLIKCIMPKIYDNRTNMSDGTSEKNTGKH